MINKLTIAVLVIAVAWIFRVKIIKFILIARIICVLLTRVAIEKYLVPIIEPVVNRFTRKRDEAFRKEMYAGIWSYLDPRTLCQKVRNLLSRDGKRLKVDNKYVIGGKNEVLAQQALLMISEEEIKSHIAEVFVQALRSVTVQKNALDILLDRESFSRELAGAVHSHISALGLSLEHLEITSVEVE